MVHMAKKRGRPPKRVNQVKRRYLQVRVDSAEKASFDAAADLAGLALSAWVRERLRLVARTELQAAGQPVAFLASKTGHPA
jgi:predicted HicB family RNase H-like nuclease